MILTDDEIKTWQQRLEETCPALGPMHIHACVEEVNDAMQAEINDLRVALQEQAREGEAVAWSDDALNRAYSDGVAYGERNYRQAIATYQAEASGYKDAYFKLVESIANLKVFEPAPPIIIAAPQPAQPSEPAQPVALPLTVDVCFIDGDDPFICTVHGKITVDALSEIEADIHENPDFGKGDGVYSYNVTRFNGQYGFEGRCELPPGWELDEIGYEPIEAAHGIGGGR